MDLINKLKSAGSEGEEKKEPPNPSQVRVNFMIDLTLILFFFIVDSEQRNFQSNEFPPT
jgi:hypothetical protein